MASLLGRHSQVSVLPETHLLLTMPPEAIVDDTQSVSTFRNFAASPRAADVAGLLDTLSPELRDRSLAYSSLLDALMEAQASKDSAACCVEKTPGHLNQVETLLRWFPTSRVICLSRDGRDVAISLDRAEWATQKSERGYALRWVREQRAIDELGRMLPSESFLRVRFEDLVRDTETTLKRAMGFIGFDYEPGQLDATESSPAVPGWESRWKEKALGSADPARASAWRGHDDKERLRQLTRWMAPELKAAGYVVDDGSDRMALRFRSWLERRLYTEPLYSGLLRVMHQRRFLSLRWISAFKTL